MSRKKREKDEEEGGLFGGVHHEAKQSIVAVLAFAAAVLTVLAIIGQAGVVGRYLDRLMEAAFGQMAILVPTTFFLFGIALVMHFRPSFFAPTFIGALLLLASALGAADIVFGNKIAGLAGFLIARPLLVLFDFWASLIIVLASAAVALMLMMNISLRMSKDEKFGDGDSGLERDSARPIGFFRSIANAIVFWKKPKYESAEIADGEKNQGGVSEEIGPAEEDDGSVESEEVKSAVNEEVFEPAKKILRRPKNRGEYKAPPANLLEEDHGKPSSGDIKANANIIERTLSNFGIDVEMAEVNIGPSVTQYTLRPAEGVKLARITALKNDLALALAAHPIRIEAPIPGRSLIGIEIPNKAIALVGLKNLIESEEYVRSRYPLTLALGRDVSGKPVYAGLNKMPHLLVAGSTGSGKSVAIHAMMMSMIYKNSPDDLKFILIDPKRVELTAYSGIPHLLSPVITDAKKTILALKWCVGEMDRRYDLLQKAGARDVHSYQVTDEAKDISMPYIVIVIDELADIMASYPRELEASIVRLAQMSRAVGIHLIVSTQRPSVEVITGLIKANITSRMAFQVASQVDSRTILDMSGAEALLGNGDMLFLAGDSGKPRRIQGAFVREEEVRKVAQYMENAYADYVSQESSAFQSSGGEDRTKKTIFDEAAIREEIEEDDELYEDARQMVLEAGKASTSYLQRRLRVGYARAARLIDMLEDRGIVGPGEGAKPREVYGEKPQDDFERNSIIAKKLERREEDSNGDFFRTMQS